MSRASDVVIVGGGIIGCAVAYYSVLKGLKVTLIDQPKRGRATSASAGGLWSIGESVGLGCGVIFHKALAAKKSSSAPVARPPILPRAFFDFSMRSNGMFAGLADELQEMVGADVEYDRSDLLFLMYDEGDEEFGKSVREKCPSGGVTSWLTSEELAKDEPAVTRENRGAVVFHGDDQVNPFRLADALRSVAKAMGATVLTRTEVVGIQTVSDRVVGVELENGRIACDAVVNAAGSWAGRVGSMVGLEVPIRPVRGQILGIEPQPEGTIRSCISTVDCYLMRKKHGEIIVGSTTEEVGFSTDVTTDAMCRLAAGAVRAVPRLARVSAKRTWSGLRPGTPDELPILGPVDCVSGYYNACGHFRTGIVNAPLSGLMLAEMLAGEECSFAVEPFLLSRFGG